MDVLFLPSLETDTFVILGLDLGTHSIGLSSDKGVYGKIRGMDPQVKPEDDELCSPENYEGRGSL